MTCAIEVAIATGTRPLYLHLIDSLQIGGAQTHLLTMLRQARRRFPMSHRVVSLFGGGPIAGQLRDLDIPVDVLDLSGQLARWKFLAAADVIAQVCREYRPLLVEAHLTWSRILGLYAAWKTKVPVRIGFEQGDMYLNSWKFRVANFVGQYFADRTIVCSSALGEWVHRTHGVARGKLLVLHNCVDVEQFAPRPNPALRALWKFPDRATICICVGTLGNGINKRVDIAIRAIAECRSRGEDVVLIVCGDGEQREKLERLTGVLGLQDVVRFLGARTDVPDVLAACDMFTHAAPFEPFGIVCIEAMAMGLPVIVPNSGGICEAVKHGETGLLYAPLDHSELARNMVRLHRDRPQRANMGLAARAAAEQQFSVETYLDRLHELYQVLGNAHETAAA